ncbi:MFS transporter, partial [Enterobacter hormaechei subsp. xiangfangensis]
MLVAYSLIGLVSALLMPEVRDRDLSEAEDAAEAPHKEAVAYGALSSRR